NKAVKISFIPLVNPLTTYCTKQIVVQTADQNAAWIFLCDTSYLFYQLEQLFISNKITSFLSDK
ncbi:TPA: hypothetical protein ACG8BD_002820, partial [Enterococcus faecium]